VDFIDGLLQDKYVLVQELVRVKRMQFLGDHRQNTVKLYLLVDEVVRNKIVQILGDAWTSKRVNCKTPFSLVEELVGV